MLDLLADYAFQKGLVAEPGFKAKTARRIIELDHDGNCVAVSSPTTKGVDFSFGRAPDLTQSEMVTLGGIATHPLLSEVSSVVLFTDKEDAEPDDKQRAKHQFFLERIQEVAEADATFRPVAIALANSATLEAIRAKLREQKAKSTDKTTFLVGDKFLIDGTGWLDWWRERRAELISGSVAKGKKKPSLAATDTAAGYDGTATDLMVCFVSGKSTEPLRVHPKITGLGDVGGQAAVPFVGFDKEAFRSYGLEQSANAAVSEESAYAYRAALDDLLKHSERLAGMKVAHWFNKHVPLDPMPLLFDEDGEGGETEEDPTAWFQDAVAAANAAEPNTAMESTALHRLRLLLQALKKHDSRVLPDLSSYRYYALSLSGAGGRVMVRDWETGSFTELAESVARWYDDFAIAPMGDGLRVPAPVLWKVIAAVKSPNETDDKGVGAVKIPLWKAALNFQRPIPDAAVLRVLNLHRAFIVTGELDNTKRKTLLSTLYLRMGLLKASLIRKGKPMNDSLNTDYPSSAYHAGRLIAMLAALQRAALPDVDAGVAQRYYGAASVTPRLVVGRLTRLAQHHVAKVASDRKGLAYWYETRIGEIVTQINQYNGGKPLPATFSPQEQTEFALGYYQQIADNRTRKADRTADGIAIVPDPAPDATTVSADIDAA